MTVMAGRLARGERLPGFGHPLYPDGDPRADRNPGGFRGYRPKPTPSAKARRLRECA